ncbi:hypothetical protein AX16_002271 [Volvariella volvacea WC 439]|nr:hypothetical protein AX16_002271 [Volvariella volvacea WC 439]
MYPDPQRGASLLLSFRLASKTTVIIGSGTLAASRAYAALEANSQVVVLTRDSETICDELRWRAEQGQVQLLSWDQLPAPTSSTQSSGDGLAAFGAYLCSSPSIRFVCVTDTLLAQSTHPTRRKRESAQQIYDICSSRNILVNVTDIPELCDFSFTSTHRFTNPTTGAKTPLQIGVTTNGQGCRLAGRVTREIVAKLPKEVGVAVQQVGKMRSLAKERERTRSTIQGGGAVEENGYIEDDAVQFDENNEDSAVATPNRPVPSRSNSETETESLKRRIKWVAQVSEYWPIPKLANMTDEDMEQALSGELLHSPRGPSASHTAGATQEGVTHPLHSIHSITLSPPSPSPPRRGRIILIGSGPGHPGLLAQSAHTVLTTQAQLVLSDKLVPAEVLNLIPSHVQVKIAKKFPGNAEGAQMEMMVEAVEAAQKGLTVVRLKQGDPSIYGRAGEEILYFRQNGFEPLVIPGISSALAGPTFAGIPVTQRGVAESFVVCTGVGRGGKEVKLPGYKRENTLVILMGVARLERVVEVLTSTGGGKGREGPAYPPHLPIAIIERATMPDQRVVSSTLKDIVKALESVGDQRPPGMIVVGWSVLALVGERGNVDVLDEVKSGAEEVEKMDIERVWRWLDGKGWTVREGLGDGWSDLNAV